MQHIQSLMLSRQAQRNDLGHFCYGCGPLPRPVSPLPPGVNSHRDQSVRQPLRDLNEEVTVWTGSGLLAACVHKGCSRIKEQQSTVASIQPGPDKCAVRRNSYSLQAACCHPLLPFVHIKLWPKMSGLRSFIRPSCSTLIVRVARCSLARPTIEFDVGRCVAQSLQRC